MQPEVRFNTSALDRVTYSDISAAISSDICCFLGASMRSGGVLTSAPGAVVSECFHSGADVHVTLLSLGEQDVTAEGRRGGLWSRHMLEN